MHIFQIVRNNTLFCAIVNHFAFVLCGNEKLYVKYIIGVQFSLCSSKTLNVAVTYPILIQTSRNARALLRVITCCHVIIRLLVPFLNFEQEFSFARPALPWPFSTGGSLLLEVEEEETFKVNQFEFDYTSDST